MIAATHLEYWCRATVLVAAVLASAAAGEGGIDPAAIAEAHELREAEAFAEALVILGDAIDPTAAPADACYLLALTAHQAGDADVRATVVERALLRFPGDQRFRLLRVHHLLAVDRRGEARLLALRLVDAAPADPDRWRLLLRAAEEPALRRAAARAVLHLDPDDRATRAFLAGELHAAGAAAAALPHARRLMTGEPSREEHLLAVAIAEAADELDLTEAWIGEEVDDDRYLRRFSLRIALRRGEREVARTHLAELIAGAGGGELHDLLLRAGALAEADRDQVDAETYYREALALDPSALACLRLARLLAADGRRDDAVAILERHLAKDPLAAAVRTLRDRLRSRAIDG